MTYDCLRKRGRKVAIYTPHDKQTPLMDLVDIPKSWDITSKFSEPEIKKVCNRIWLTLGAEYINFATKFSEMHEQDGARGKK